MRFGAKLDGWVEILNRILDCFRRRYYPEVRGSDGSDESSKAERSTIQRRCGLLEASV